MLEHVNDIKSTFPSRKMTKHEILEYLEHNEELIILSTYILCSLEDLIDNKLNIRIVFTGNNKNEYDGDFNEYYIISKKII